MITIIVLLILAGITIASIQGDNGIINKGQEAKVKTEILQYQEQLDIIKYHEYGKSYTIDNIEFLETYAEAVRNDEMFKEAKEVSVDEENELVVVITKEGYIFEVTIDDIVYVGNDDGSIDIDINDVTVEITKEPTSWTNGKVSVKISTNIRGITKQYSLDNGKTWEEYSKPIEIENNGTEIQARAVNENNEMTKVVTEKIENIDRLAPEIATPKVTGIAKGIKVEVSAQDKEQTETDGKSGIKGYQFSNNNGTSWTEIGTSGTYTFNNLDVGTYQIKVKVIDNAGNEAISQAVSGSPIINIPDAEGKIVFSQTPNSWTNQDVTVTMQGPSEYTIEYSVDGGNYQDYKSTGVVMSQNGTIKARLKIGSVIGKETSYIVNKIDKLPPNGFTPKVQATTSTLTVIADAVDQPATSTNGSSGIRGYKYSKDDGKTWTEEKSSNTYTFTGLEQGQTCQIKVIAIDNAGNETISSVAQGTTTKIPEANGNIKVERSETEWTNKAVTVTLSTSLSGYSIEYAINNTNNWMSYDNKPINVEDNNTAIYARLTDGKGGTGNYITETISNIDRLAPRDVSLQVEETTSNSIKVRVNAEDADATNIDGKSGIAGYKYSINNQEYTYVQNTQNYTFTRLQSDQSYQIKVIAVDNAGNEQSANVLYANTDKMPDPGSNIVITKTPDYPTWTRSVQVTMKSTAGSNFILQYSTDNQSWIQYTDNGITITENNKRVYARLYDPNSKEATSSIDTQITNIDTLSPNVFTPTVSASTATTITVRVNGVTDQAETAISGCSGIRGYKYSKDNGKTWTAETTESVKTFASLAPGTDYQIVVCAIDNAGNEQLSYMVIGTTQNMVDENDIIISGNPTQWTNQNAYLTISKSSNANGYTLKYSVYNDNNWQEYYNQQIEMTTNGTIYAELVDSSGYTVATKSETVTKIDKTKPTATYTTDPVSGLTSNVVTINLNLSDDASGINYNSIQCTSGEAITKISNTSYKVTKNGNYTFIFEDNAKNQSSLNVNISNVLDMVVEDLKAGDKVYFETVGKGTVECIVLYDTEYNNANKTDYGIQIVTNNTLESVILGNDDPTIEYTGGVNGVESYNRAIQNLNNRSEKYLNLIYATDARSIGSKPDDKNAESGLYVEDDDDFQYARPRTFKDADLNYEKDYEQIKKLGIQKSDDDYWLASRLIYRTELVRNLNMRRILSSGDYSPAELVSITSVSEANHTIPAGLRPVFTLRPEIKITGGNGDTIPYTLGI